MLNGSVSRLSHRRLERLFHSGIDGDLSDSELLDRFVRCGDMAGEAAFSALVERHGPMVYRVCRQVLGDHHAAQDAVQATFLVLAGHAGAIRKRTSVSSWLFGVARRVAARIRMEEARRRLFESRSAVRSLALISAGQEAADPDPYPELHAEIERLPEKYRVPIVLCYLEGLTHEQAAGRLRWPLGTVKIRLSRARDRLRSRLEKRGRPPLLLLPGNAFRAGHLAELPERFVSAITEAGCRYAATRVSGGLVSGAVANITREVMKSMLFHKLKVAGVMFSGLVLLAFGAVIAAQQANGRGSGGQALAVARAKNESPSTLQVAGVVDYAPEMAVQVRTPFDCRVDNVLVDLGQRVKIGDPLLELFSADLADAKGNYETAVSQWLHDQAVLDYKSPLVQSNQMPRKEIMEAKHAEEQSRIKMKLAKDKLLVYGLSEHEIENAKQERGVQKAKMIFRSRGEGVVIKRNVVRGNYYTSADILMTIARLDHLWVRGSVSDLHAERIQVGRNMTVVFPFRDGRVKAKVEYVDPQVDHDTQTLKFRTSIPNPDYKYKPGTFVRMVVETDTPQERTGEPRTTREQPPDATVRDRLSELERKLDRLLGEKEERLSHAKILDRLEALERKVDRVLETRQ